MSVIPSPQAKLIFFAPKPDGNRLFLIDGAAREDSERREIVGFADNELGAPQGSLHGKPQAMGGGAKSHAHRELATKQQSNLLARTARPPSQPVHRLNLTPLPTAP